MQRNHRKVFRVKPLVHNQKDNNVIPLISKEEKEFIDLVAEIFVNSIIYETSNRIHKDIR